MSTSVQKASLFNRFLDSVERVGNKLPHPATLFALMALLIVLLSAVAATLGLTAEHPVTGEIVKVKNLLTSDGIRWIWTNVEKNFVDFPPLGLVLVVMVGIGVSEGSGLFTVLVRHLVS